MPATIRRAGGSGAAGQGVPQAAGRFVYEAKEMVVGIRRVASYNYLQAQGQCDQRLGCVLDVHWGSIEPSTHKLKS